LGLGFFAYDLNRWFFLSFTSLITVTFLFVRTVSLSFQKILSRNAGAFLVIVYMIAVGMMQYGFFEWQKPRTVGMEAIFEIKEKIGKIPKL
jgi:hypothetical protein